MKAKQKIVITLIVGIVLILGFFGATNLITKYTGFSIFGSEENDFVRCLKEQEIVLYVKTSKDRNNIAQILENIQLYDYLEYVKIVDCFKNRENCLEKGIDSPTTWVINNNQIDKDISLEELFMLSGCRL